MPTSLIRFAFISFLLSSAAVFSADNVPISTEISASQITPQPISNSQLPEWFYRELTSIRKDVSVLDATGASKEQIQELKERIGKIEVRIEESQKHTDDKLIDQSERIGDIAESNTFSITLFAVIAGVLGTLIAVITIINSWKANREAVANAQDAAQKTLEGWTQEKEAELTEKFDQKLTELSAHHEKEFQKIRDNAEEQAFDGDINEAYALASKDRIDDAMSRINNVIKRIENSDLIKHQRAHSKALYYKGLISYAGNQMEGVLKVFDELILKFEDSDDAAIQEQVAKALLNKGAFLGQLNRSGEEMAAYDALFDRFKDSNENATQQQVAKALYNKCVILGQLNRSGEEVAAYDAFFDWLKGRDDAAIQELVAKALYNKGVSFGQLKRLEEAIAVYDELLNQFKDSDDAAIQERIISAVCNKAELVLATQPKDQAIKAIQNAIALIKEGSKVDRAAMEMLSLIINESTVDKVYSCVVDIPNDAKLTWEFGSIREVVDTLEFPRKEQVQAFARYFEDHHDKAKLKEELDQISKL